MSEQEATSPALGPEQQFLNDLWDEHVRDEFVTHDTAATLDTMVPDAYVNHIPVLTGGVGREQLGEFYSRHFIPRMPPDTTILPVSRTIGTDRLVDEMIFRFTHTIEMDWMLPGIPPTGKPVEVPLVAVVHFRGGSWPTSTYTGTKPPCSSNSASSTRRPCQWRVPRARPRSSTRRCRRTPL
jgi:carboxymethylenebutenolidase